MNRWLVLMCVASLAGCKRQDMYTQERTNTYDRSAFLRHGSAMQIPVAGTVARDEPNRPAPEPAHVTEALLRRGQQRFDIFCQPCHGAAGDGQGIIVQRGFPQPPSMFDHGLMVARAQLFYDTITNGHGDMYSYADRVPPPDRWAITAYIRALQLSQGAPAASLQAADRVKLEAAR